MLWYNPGCNIIDIKGCPLDSDGDGLDDCRDECPYEYGEKKNGCPSLITPTLLYVILPGDITYTRLEREIAEKLMPPADTEKERRKQLTAAAHCCEMVTA